MGKYKTKAIQAALGIPTHIPACSGIFRHTQAYSECSRIIQAHSEPCATLVYLESWHTQNQKRIQNPGIFRSLLYSGAPYIQNPSICRTLAHSESQVYSELYQKSTMYCFAKLINGYNYFPIK